MQPKIGLLLGDPSGIGPEVAAKTLAARASAAEVVIIGSTAVWGIGAMIAGVKLHPNFRSLPGPAGGWGSGEVSQVCGAYALESIRAGVTALREYAVDALVYAPLNKKALKLAGMAHDDELHLFAELLGWHGPFSEINICGNLWTSRVTSHVPLDKVPALLTQPKIMEAAHLLNSGLKASGVHQPRIAVAGLNPHAGEGGTLGDEEIRIIAPAVQALQNEGIKATGPHSADTLFIAARRGDYDGVVTMYHDQGQIAMKLMGFDKGVTLSGGLPHVITTPAHGTAFDIANQGKADPGAMIAAFDLACRMVRTQRGG